MKLPKLPEIPSKDEIDELYLRRILSDVRKAGEARIGFEGSTFQKYETEILRVAKSMHMTDLTCHRTKTGDRITIRYQPPVEKQIFKFDALQGAGDSAEFEVPRNRESYFRSKASMHARGLGLSSQVSRLQIGTLRLTLTAPRSVVKATQVAEVKEERQPSSKYRFETLTAIGASVLLNLPRPDHIRVRMSASAWGQRYGMKLSCSVEGSAIRVTRTA